MSGGAMTFQSSFALTSAEKFILLLALSFLILAGLSVIFIFVSRLVKSIRVRKRNVLREATQPHLYQLIANEYDIESAKFRAITSQLASMIGQSTLKRQVLTDQMIELKKSVSGAAARCLSELYTALNLNADSLRKIRSWSWYDKASGIREVSEMDHKPAIQLLEKYLDAPNTTLREEALIALVKLNTGSDFSFLDRYQGTISDWLVINLHKHLASRDQRTTPSFERWLNNPNESVVMFALQMMKKFKQYNQASAVSPLVVSKNKNVAKLALETLTELEAFTETEFVSSIIQTYWEEDVLCISAIKYLGQAGDPHRDISVIEKFLSHPNYLVRFEALLALKKLKADPALVLSWTTQYEQLNKIHVHQSEALLQ